MLLLLYLSASIASQADPNCSFAERALSVFDGFFPAAKHTQNNNYIPNGRAAMRRKKRLTGCR